MDGSVSASMRSTERTREQLSQLFHQRGGTATSDSQSSLFEQLLSIPVAPQSHSDASCCDNPSSHSDSIDGPDSSVSDQSKVDQEEQTEEKEEVIAPDDTSPLVVAQAPAGPVAVEENPQVAEGEQEQLKDIDCDCATHEERSPKPTDTTPLDIATEQTEATKPNSPMVLQSTAPESEAVGQIEETTAEPMNAELAESQRTAAVRREADATQVVEASADQPAIDRSEVDIAALQGEREAADQTPKSAEPEVVQPAARNEEGKSRPTNRREKWFERDTSAQGFKGNEALRKATNESAADALTPQEASLQEIANSLGIQASDVAQQIEQAASANSASVTSSMALAPVVAANVTSVVAALATGATTGEGSGGGGTSPNGSSSNSTSTSNAIQATSGSNNSGSSGSAMDRANSKDPAGAPELTQQERVRLVQRVSRSFNRMTAEGGQINLRLHPQSLGSLNMQVQIEGRTLSAKLTTETSAARDAILQDLPALRQRLAEQGYDVAKFQVEVANNGADASFAQSQGQSQFGEPSGQGGYKPTGYEIDYRRMASRSFETPQLVSSFAPALSSLQTGAGIDLHA